MSTAQKVAVNTGIILAGRLAELLIRLVPVIFMTRYLGGEGYGEYAYILAFVGFFSIFIDMGIDTILVRETSIDSSRIGKLVGNVIIMKFFLSIIIFIVALTGAYLLDVSRSKFTGIAIVAVILLFEAYKVPLDSYFRINLKMQYSSLATVVGSVVFATAVLLVIYLKGNIMHFLAAYALSYIVDFIVTLSLSLKFVKPELGIDAGLWKQIIRSAIPVGLADIFIVTYGKLGILMLAWMQNDAAVGYYAAPSGLIYKLDIIPWALTISLLPVFSQYYDKNKSKWERANQLNFKYLLVVSLPLAVFISLFSGRIIDLIFGGKFSASALVLSILIWSKVFVFLNYQLIRAIVSAGRQGLFTLAAGIMVVLNIVLNFLLIPGYSYIGASYAILFTEAFGTILLFYFLSSSTRMPMQVSMYIRLALITAALYLFIPVANLNVWMAFPVMVILYIPLLFALRVVDEEDISLFRMMASMRLDKSQFLDLSGKR
ncbi:MAG: flippase [Candidatus Methanoperedens sp.]|nr:flippase [Candidatus Methanoperedens sp.]